MLEIKVLIEAPEITVAINSLSEAVRSHQNAVADDPSIITPPRVNRAKKAPASRDITASNNELNDRHEKQESNTEQLINNSGNEDASSESEVEPKSSEPVPEKKEYTLEILSKAGASLVNAGKMNEIIMALKKYGVLAVNKLPPDKFNDFADDLRGMGADI